MLNMSWMNCMQQSVDSSWELATQLSKCGDPAAFTTVLHAAFYASVIFMVIAAVLSGLRARSFRRSPRGSV